MASLVMEANSILENSSMKKEVDFPVNNSPDGDSGRWSFENELPGTLREEETAEEIVVVLVSPTEIPPPPPLPPLPNSSYLCLLPGATLPDDMFQDVFHWEDLHSLPATEEAFVFPGSRISNDEFKSMLGKEEEEDYLLLMNHQPVGTPVGTCPICCEPMYSLARLNCCNSSVCKQCMESFIEVNVREGRPYMPCPIPGCDRPLQRDFISQHITGSDLKLKYERFRLNYEGDGSKKTCPNCCLITERELSVHNNKQVPPTEYMVYCEGCQFEWCFNCHSPWHEGMSCEAYRIGDRQFHEWTKERHCGYVPNCQKCPKCKVFIERSEGCDHMTCNRCQTHFCYKCGGKFISYPFLGDHYKRLAVLGCPYNFNPDKPAKRRFLRGGYLFVKGAAMTGYPVILVGGVALVAVGAAVVLPVVGGAILYKYVKRKRRGY